MLLKKPTTLSKHDFTACWVFLWLVMVLLCLTFRPVLPVDETRYLSVAWEMWHNGNFLVPHANGIPYSHKPPLFFYLIHAGWALFGVNEWSARLTSPFVGLLNLFLTSYLARRLWPGQNSVARLVPFVLLGFPIWALFSTLTMFDIILTFFVLSAAAGLISAGENGGLPAWGLTALSVGAGLLAKGPVIFVFVLPIGIFAPWWTNKRGSISWVRWYLGVFFSILAGLSIAMVWALPAAKSGGEDYGKAILWGQTAGRVIKSFAHSRPPWWYLSLLPLVLFPWFFQTNVLKGLARFKTDQGIRFCLSAILPSIALLSLVSGKQIHYLIPTLPFAALAATRLMTASPMSAPGRLQWPTATLFIITGIFLVLLPYLPIASSDIPEIKAMPGAWGVILLTAGIIFFMWKPGNTAAVKGICTAIVFFIIFLHVGPLRELTPAFDVSEMAQRISFLQKAGEKIAVYPPKYSSQFQFQGRLERPLTVLKNREAMVRWARQNPDSYTVIFTRKSISLPLEQKPIYIQRFKGKWMSLWKASDLSGAIQAIK